MRIQLSDLQSIHASSLEFHTAELNFLQEQLGRQGIDGAYVLDKLKDFQVAIPSWALGAGGTRFGRFSMGGEPSNLGEKIDDIGLVHALTRAAGAISLHIPWDIPDDPAATLKQAHSHGLVFDAVNSNTFQDQAQQTHSYKFGSLSHRDSGPRRQAIEHNKEVIDIGTGLGSKSLTVWLADGSSFPGQHNFKQLLKRTQASLQEIYAYMPADWKMFIEYKPYEPNFYSTVIQDWGTSCMLAQACGDRAYTLVDLGHHLPNTNIEQIVGTLMMQGRLGGFHFNDSKYGDDDLTVGSIKPYQLFLIFNELIDGMVDPESMNPPLAWMIDASHNIKDPLEDLIQSLEAIRIAYAQALLIDREALTQAQASEDVVQAQEILQTAYRTDVRPLVREARLSRGGALAPIEAYRALHVREQLIAERGTQTMATGL